MITIYGIKTCTSVKKALTWLEQRGIRVTLHDFRQQGIESAWLEQMERVFGWEQLVNKRSTTWRNLPEDQKKNLQKSTALSLLLAYPTLIKRPIICQEGIALIGFEEASYQQAFQKLI